MTLFKFEPFWKVTNWGFLKGYVGRINSGTDEFLNITKFVIIPMIGIFTWYTGETCIDEVEDAN